VKSASDDNDVSLEKRCATNGVNDMVVSDDDSATVDKTLNTPSNDNSSYSGSDDGSVIESDQPLFLDTISPVSTSVGRTSHGSDNGDDALLGCNVGVESEDDAMMADFLSDTFEPKPAASSAFGDVLNACEMDILLGEVNDEVMLLPDICLENC
jgi:hypothetical protein